nr:hypothetical protein [uncultured bacterium]
MVNECSFRRQVCSTAGKERCTYEFRESTRMESSEFVRFVSFAGPSQIRTCE